MMIGVRQSFRVEKQRKVTAAIFFKKDSFKTFSYMYSVDFRVLGFMAVLLAVLSPIMG